MKWITRERPKIDRIACPWLVTRFIDKQPEFLYVPADKVLSEAKRQGAIPYDVPDVELSHVGPLCSFDAFLAGANAAAQCGRDQCLGSGAEQGDFSAAANPMRNQHVLTAHTAETQLAESIHGPADRRFVARRARQTGADFGR